jgi:long-chain acyl-CoA synthetase
MSASDTIALIGAERRWTTAELEADVSRAAAQLTAAGTRVLATLLDNGPAWVVADRAAARAGIVHVPLPLFFTPAQVAHALHAAGVDTLLTPLQAASRFAPAAASPWPLADDTVACIRLPAAPVHMPVGTRKVTFTSGTTGAPKGVCLRADAMQAVAAGLIEALEPVGIRHHLCALPLAVLLENIAGLDAPLARGAACTVLPLSSVGLSGSSGFDAAVFDAAVRQHQPDSLILLPQMLRAWVGHLAARRQTAPVSLRFVAVGGAAVGQRVLTAARAMGIPAFEGYGLSEGASVQTLNLPGHDRPGSAGRPLPHARVRVGPEGDIEVAGSLFAGYLGDPTTVPARWPTGDLGRIDDDGFVHIHGRRKQVLVTAFGRNVSPEWVETALRSEPVIAQAVVFGDGQPALSAVLWPATPEVAAPALDAAVQAANASLPDYAQVRHWVRAQGDFTPEAGLATPNGRPLRAAIQQRHAAALAAVSEPLSTELP